MVYKCDHCNVTFSKESNLIRHVKNPPKKCSATHVKDVKDVKEECEERQPFFRCGHCNATFSKESNLIRHVKNPPQYCIDLQEPNFSCEFCSAAFASGRYLNRHLNNRPKNCLKAEISNLKLENAELRCSQAPKTINITNNIVSLTPTDFSDILTVENVRKAYDENKFRLGGEGASAALMSILNNENETRYICTDVARKKFKYKNSYGKMITDVKASKLWKAGKNSIKEVVGEYKNQFIRKFPLHSELAISSSQRILNADVVPPAGFAEFATTTYGSINHDDGDEQGTTTTDCDFAPS